MKRDPAAFADPAALQHALNTGLDDPTLTIKYTLDSGALVDIHGRPVQVGKGRPPKYAGTTGWSR